MTENNRFTMDNPNDWGFPITDNVTGKLYNCASNILMKELCVDVNTIVEENEQLKKQKTRLLRIIDNNIEIYENINTNVEFHQGEIQGKLTVLTNLREVILND